MTNLTSEQYRDVIKNVENRTEKLPSVQQLLRRAVETFFDRFGAYPELGGVAPGKLGIFGEQTQFDGGLALPAATPMATVVVGRRARGPRFAVATSADVGKPRKVKFSFSRNRPLGPGRPEWLNRVKGVIANYPGDVPPFEAAIESSVPMGVGLGSSSAVETAALSFLEVLVGKRANALDKAKACQKVEEDYALKKVGLVDRIAAVLAKDRHAMLIDCKTNRIEWIPFRDPDLAFVAIDSHERDFLRGDEYPERSKYISKACEVLGVESLRECTEEDVMELENRVNGLLKGGKEDDQDGDEEEEEEEEETIKPSRTKVEEEKLSAKIEKHEDGWSKEEYEIMIKRAKFFITEMQRISDAVEALNEGDFESFGERMKESHKSLNEDFDFKNPLLNFLVETSLQVEGVLGSKMTGMGLGFGGGIVSLVKKEKIENYCDYVTEKFAINRDRLQNAVREQRQQDKEKRYEIKRKARSEHYNPAIASSERIGKIQSYLEEGGVLSKVPPKKLSEGTAISSERRRTPCIVKVEKPPSGCGTWGRYEKSKQKEEFFRKKSMVEEEEVTKEESLTTPSQISEVHLKKPTFYVVSPFAGARMLFVTKADMLRSLYACPIPHPKALIRSTLEEFKSEYDIKPEAVGAAPATLTLFGEFMEFHLGYIICMALPLITVTVGGRNDSVYFSFKTTSEEVEGSNRTRNPLPCVQTLRMDPRTWVNYASGCVNEFKGHVPGFSAVIGSSVPLRVGLNSCSALQASIYTFLENLTRNCTADLLDKAERCAKSEYEFQPATSELVTRCSSIKFLPTFICEEGNLMFVNCKRYKISQYFFDHPSYAFLVGCCRKNTTDLTVESLDERLKMCANALEILGRNSLLNADAKHLRCLRKRLASEETIRRVRYVITEHRRTVEAVKAIKDEDYRRVGLLMNQSHASLRDDYGVSSPEIETLVSLALSVEGVLGAKMVGRGLNATVVILLKIEDVDKCIRHVRKNFRPRSDRPFFYVAKPSGGAFMMDPKLEFPLIP